MRYFSHVNMFYMIHLLLQLNTFDVILNKFLITLKVFHKQFKDLDTFIECNMEFIFHNSIMEIVHKIYYMHNSFFLNPQIPKL